VLGLLRQEQFRCKVYVFNIYVFTSNAFRFYGCKFYDFKFYDFKFYDFKLYDFNVYGFVVDSSSRHQCQPSRLISRPNTSRTTIRNT
jgi:hypothetical protein